MKLADLLPIGLSPENAIVGLAGGAAFLVVLAVWYGLLARDPMASRVKALAARRGDLKSDLTAPKRRHERRVKSLGFMRRVVERLKLMSSAQAAKIAERLARAGWRSKDAIVVFLFFKAALPLVFATAAVVVLYVLELYDLPSMARLAAALGSVAVGAYAPDIYVRNAASKRRQKLRKGLPDALDLMVICAEAGLTLDASLSRVSRELGASAPELADELGLTAVELGFLPDRRQALSNLNLRTDLPGIRGMVNTLVQTEKYGTPLALSLRVLASEFRDERLLRAEEKAARLPATMTVPLVVFILPALFIVLIGPAILSALDNLRGF